MFFDKIYIKVNLIIIEMGLPIITHYENREIFLSSLHNNPGLIFVKFGADWCGPCKKIDEDVNRHFHSMPDTVQCAIIDIDQSIDVYAFLKSKKITQGIPTILCYYKGNTHYVPDDVITGSDKNALTEFFKRCLEEL
jgi:thioredoxin-like negative regulator of GroEL